MATLDVSKTYLAEMFRTEGRTEGVRESIRTVGARRFGAAPTEVVAAVESITDSDRLHGLLERPVTAANWQDLLATDA